MNPECRDGKHRLCNGDGLDAATDTIFLDGCPCRCHDLERTGQDQ